MGRNVDRHQAAGHLSRRFGEVFGLEMKRTLRDELLEKLHGCEEAVAVSA
jgi:hypothetical protein